MDKPERYSDEDRVSNIQLAANYLAEEGLHGEATDLREHALRLRELSKRNDNQAASIRQLRSELPGPWKATHRHLKTGREYRFIGVGKIERDWDRDAAMYCGPDGMIIARDMEEFSDGRFEQIGETDHVNPTGLPCRIDVSLMYDNENAVWCMLHTNVPGLTVESGDLKTAFDVIGDVVDELIAANG